MQAKTVPKVSAEFLEDHQVFTRLLHRLMGALRQRDNAQARSLAEELDRTAGSHIEFEESVLYPAVGRVHGREFMLKLLGEHHTALDAIRKLLAAGPREPLDEGTRQQIERGIEVALEHVESCGTLVSHLSTLGPAEQADALERLEECRRLGHRWSELAEPSAKLVKVKTSTAPEAGGASRKDS